MKKVSIILILALAVTVTAQAQQSAKDSSPASVLGITPNLRSGFQFSLRGGYDIPFYPTLEEYYDNKQMKTKGGVMGGLSADYYWDWIGVGVCGDYIRNTLVNPYKYDYNAQSSTLQTRATVEVNINNIPTTRMFVGAGPNFRYLNPLANFSAELNTRAGLGYIMGKNVDNLNAFNAKNVFSIKAQTRFTYFVNTWMGFHTGAYYMHHFGVPYTPINSGEIKTNISSIGVFAGVTFRLSPLPVAPKAPVAPKTPEALVINGVVVICKTSTPIEGVNIIVTEKKNGQERRLLSDKKGEFSFTVTPASEITIYGKKSNYFSQVVTLGPADFKRYRNVRLEICMERVDCDESVRLENIHYDLDKYDIRPDARPELDRLVQFLRDNPEVRVELSSHTDSRASHEYNERLSQNRANSARQYVISRGIDPSRVISVGYGETRLLNRCADGVNCSEAEHQLNRRTEMKVICPK